MKKWLLMVAVVVLSLLTACSTSDETNATTEENTKVTKKEETNESVAVDKGLLKVEITLPASLFEGEDVDNSIAEAEEDGIEVKKNDDGSLTYKMSKSKHKEMMEELETGLIESVEEMKNSEDFVSIQDVTYNKSFSEFTMVVDKAAYENSFDGFATFGLALSGMYYQLFDGVDPNEYEVKIMMKDAATDEVFDEVVYPEALEAMGAEETQE
jgi:major membrane immunogen (membrane-anchored lipoprotein)